MLRSLREPDQLADAAAAKDDSPLPPRSVLVVAYRDEVDQGPIHCWRKGLAAQDSSAISGERRRWALRDASDASDVRGSWGAPVGRRPHQ